MDSLIRGQRHGVQRRWGQVGDPPHSPGIKTWGAQDSEQLREPEANLQVRLSVGQDPSLAPDKQSPGPERLHQTDASYTEVFAGGCLSGI